MSLHFAVFIVVLYSRLARMGEVILKYSVHYSDVIMGTIASQITSLTIVYSTIYSDADQRRHLSCAENSPGTGEFAVQMASYPENVSI